MGCTSSAAHERVQVPGVPTHAPSPELQYYNLVRDIPGSAGFNSPASLPQYCLGRRLGAGTYATVYALRSQILFKGSPSRQTPLAAKVIKFYNVWSPNQNVETPKLLYEKALHEADVWERVCSKHCDFLVSLVQTFLDDRRVVFVMELCHATLAQHMRNCPRLNESTVAGLVAQMLRSLQHIHSFDVIHRDVKPDNFLVSKDETLKISDFGLAVVSDNIWEQGNEPHPTRNPSPAPMVAGTAPFMSPEMVSKVVYSTRTDIWSLGCVAYVMLTGQFPYMPKVMVIGQMFCMPREMSTSAMKAAVREGYPAPSFKPSPDALFPDAPKGSYNGPSTEAVAFLESALARDPAARPTAFEALEHPYLSRKLSAEDCTRLPCLRSMLKRATRCGAFSRCEAESIDLAVKQCERQKFESNEALFEVDQQTCA